MISKVHSVVGSSLDSCLDLHCSSGAMRVPYGLSPCRVDFCIASENAVVQTCLSIQDNAFPPDYNGSILSAHRNEPNPESCHIFGCTEPAISVYPKLHILG